MLKYSISTIMNISAVLTNWYKIHKRELPWRNTKDPYFIWISEIILQQTRVNQGMEYYLEFIRRFPDIHSLATSSLDEVLKAWQGLGYYTRARNLHATAQYIYYQMDGRFPENYEELIRLKGIGDYTASAIASFAFGKPVAVVDGNVQRVISRISGISTPVNTTRGKKQIKKEAEKLLPSQNTELHNQAMIEFGAIQCIPRNPECINCPLNQICYAFHHNIVEELPGKRKNKKKRLRYFYYLTIQKNGHLFFQKRAENDIWNSLYQFPLIESDRELKMQEITDSKEWEEIFKNLTPSIKKISNTYTHLLTHQKIYACFVEIEISSANNFLLNNYTLIERNKIQNLAVPRLIEKYLEEKI
ncbi:MAG: A/G-specific adenine glycosylase [Bacteroidales bacterium]|nr:A/G-specific adenine glycosylase [Bacteroidales bacterium]MBS3773649.1 A/G-specific adenine glycosylase [Bacteroidales bacterium]